MWPGRIVQWLIAIALAGCWFGVPADAAEIDNAAIRANMKAYWDSITTLEVTGEEFPIDSSLRRREGPEITHHDLRVIYGSNDRLSFRRVQKRADGTITGSHLFREDSRVFLGITAFPDDPDAIDSVVIRNQADKPGHHEGEMCLLLWAWMPGGRPVPAWLEGGGKMDREGGESGQEVVVTAELRKRPLRITLDPSHDWLPKRIEMSGFATFTIRAFARDQGHWFPSEVTEVIEESALPAGSGFRSGYKLATLAVNRGVAEGTFGMPKLPEGAIVRDERDWSGYIQGGIDARRRLDQARQIANPDRSEGRSAINASQVVVAVEPGRFPWEVALAGGATVALALSWKLHRNS